MAGESSHPSEDRLAAFARGDLLEAEASTIEDHLATCPICLDRADSRTGDDEFVAAIRLAASAGVPAEPTARASATPSGYELIETIGRGGMGVVFRARQRSLGRVVALKQIRAGLDADEKELARFRAEAEAMARLRHPNIVQVFDVGVQDGLPFLAMELVEGESLARRLAAGPLAPEEAARLVRAVAQAVQHAHEAEVIHRDLTPSNILFTADGEPKVADFGLAKRVDLEGGETRTGALLGTPSYMSPEQAEGSPAGPGSDIYALGAILYECLTGRPPFRAATPLSTLEQVRSMDPPNPVRLQPGTPRDLQTIAMCCLEKEPRRRYETAVAVADDLGRFLRHEPIRARPARWPERLAKWVRRRPHQAGLAALSVVTVVGALAGLAVHNRRLEVEIGRANDATATAERESRLAKANYREARDAIRDVLEWTEDPRFAIVPQRVEIHRLQSERALPFYEKVLAADSGDPAVRRDTALAAIEAATLQIELGRTEEAERNLKMASGLYDALLRADAGDADALKGKLTSLVKMGVMGLGKDKERSLELFQEARGLATELERRGGTEVDGSGDAAWCEYQLGLVLFLMGRRADAMTHFREASRRYRVLVDEAPEEPSRADKLASTIVQIAEIDRLAGRLDEADGSLSEAMVLFERVSRSRVGDHAMRGNFAQLYIAWGNIAMARSRPEEALRRFELGISQIEPVLTREPSLGFARATGVALHGSRSNALAVLNRYREAAEELDRVLELEDDPAERTRFRLLRSLRRLNSPDYARGLEEAEELAAEMSAKGPVGPADAYNFACFYALASRAARDDDRLGEAERASRADGFGDAAMEWLKRSAEAGFFEAPSNVEAAAKDTDLDAIRGREEFGRIVSPGR